MPINIPDDLPARRVLEREGVLVIGEHDAIRQDIRPMQIALLNLMPEKIKTETQISRLVGSTPLQVEMTLLKTSSYTPTTTPSEHMLAFYKPWAAVAQKKFDGLIVTGAPVEEMAFEEVDYWTELTEIFDWTTTNVSWVFNLCWAGQAALHHFHGIPKCAMARKLSGVYEHRVVTPNSELLRGFADKFQVPVSRYTETRRADIEPIPQLSILAESDVSGLCLIVDRELNQAHMFNHLEYDTETLANEYRRDVKAGRDIAVPENYFPHDDAERAPVNSWRGHGHLLFSNWINTMYQTAPSDIAEIGKDALQPDAALKARGSAAAR
jgi:homoserine O-succinyltransferase